MTERFVNQAKANMSALERLLKGLPGIEGYVDKELRRDADKRLRELLATQMNEQKQQLFAIQKQLLSNGGLRWLDDVDQVIQKLQTLTDRIKTASYGYAGLFDAVKIGEEQLAVLHQFDLDLAHHVAKIDEILPRLQSATTSGESIQPVLQELSQAITEMYILFNHRRDGIVAPDLLVNAGDNPTAL